MTEPKKNSLPAVAPEAAAAPVRPKIVYRLSCGAGPCKAVRIVEGTSRRVEDDPKLPPVKEES